MKTILEVLEYSLIEVGKFNLTVLSVLSVVLLFFAARAVMWVIGKLVDRAARRRADIDPGRSVAVMQIAKYAIYIIFTLLALESIGIQLTWLMASSAALLVGIGFGLQNTFNDFLSGIIILFDGSIEVGDVVQVGDLIGRINRIGIRTTTLITRDAISVIIPNSKFTSENVINWSHGNHVTRFNVAVGVAYGSDVKLVMQTLLESAYAHQEVLDEPAPQSRFLDFGDSALLFEIFFWTQNTFGVELIKSDIRVAIDAAFRAKGITIPFPQRDLHIVSDSRKGPSSAPNEGNSPDA